MLVILFASLMYKGLSLSSKRSSMAQGRNDHVAAYRSDR